MGRARVVAPPPQDYVPEPLVSPPAPPPVDEEIAQEWIDGNFQEQLVEIAKNEPSEEELAKERIAQQRYEEIQRQKQEEAERQAKIEEQKKLELEEAERARIELERERDRLAAIAHEQLQKSKERPAEEERLAKLEEQKKAELEEAERIKRELQEEKDRLAAIAHAKLQEAKKAQEVVEEPAPRVKLDKKESKQDAKLKAELDALRAENERLAREKEAAEKAREQQIVAMRNKATEQRGNQLNMVKQRKPSLWARFKALLKRRRIEIATVGIKNYETAILQRARIAVPKMLDDIEKMHEQLTILEELLAKHKEREKIKD